MTRIECIPCWISSVGLTVSILFLIWLPDAQVVRHRNCPGNAASTWKGDSAWRLTFMFSFGVFFHVTGLQDFRTSQVCRHRMASHGMAWHHCIVRWTSLHLCGLRCWCAGRPWAAMARSVRGIHGICGICGVPGQRRQAVPRAVSTLQSRHRNRLPERVRKTEELRIHEPWGFFLPLEPLSACSLLPRSSGGGYTPSFGLGSVLQERPGAGKDGQKYSQKYERPERLSQKNLCGCIVMLPAQIWQCCDCQDLLNLKAGVSGYGSWNKKSDVGTKWTWTNDCALDRFFNFA